MMSIPALRAAIQHPGLDELDDDVVVFGGTWVLEVEVE
jgi:hypothetical protein